MSEIIVSANELTKNKEELSTLKKTFEGQIRKLEAESKSLNSMWDGEAKRAYQTSMGADIAKLMAFLKVLVEIIAILETIISLYRKMEQKNSALAAGH